MKSIKLSGVKVNALTLQEALLELEKPQVIFTPNPEIILEARKNKALQRALKVGTLFLADGHGLQFVTTLQHFHSRMLRLLLFLPALFLYLVWKKPFTKDIPQVIHGSDFMAALVAWSELSNKSVFFLGAKEGVAQKVAEFFKAQHPRLRVAGYSSLDPGDEAFKLVRKSGAEVVLVAYGSPKQELWIEEYSGKLPRLFHIMEVGGAFDFWGGELPRAPFVLRKLGLEWLWRLLLQPKQRAKRIWAALVQFPLTSLFS